jgi:hypothetical protein
MMMISRWRGEGRTTVKFTLCNVKPYGVLKIRITLVKSAYFMTEHSTCGLVA